MNIYVERLGLWLLRAALAIGAFLAFFAWAPLLDSNPISALMLDQIPPGGVPEWAKSFHINHGDVAFSSYGVPSDEPLPFIVLVIFSLVAVTGLVMSFRKDQRMRFFRRRFSRKEN